MPSVRGSPINSCAGFLRGRGRGGIDNKLRIAVFGNMPNDNSNLILSADERSELLTAHPQLTPYVRPLYGAKDFIDSNHRFCLWLLDADPAILKTVPAMIERLRLPLASQIPQVLV
ncbi:MAG: type IIL restriction-modification enzyme MmeI [Novosphingobium sp.]